MVNSWNYTVGIMILLFFLILSQNCCSQSCRNEAIPYFSVYYVQIGGDVDILVNAFDVKYSWVKDGKPITAPKCKNFSESDCTNAKMFSSEEYASLFVKNIAPEDSGKYIVELVCPSHRGIYSFEVIVISDPLLYIDCKDMVVYEGENISCICKATGMNSPISVTWIWNKTEQVNSEMNSFTDILSLVNVSRMKSGTYTCRTKSNNLVNDTSFKLEVIPKITESANAEPTVKINCSVATTPAEPRLNERNVDVDIHEMEWKIRLIVGSCSYFAGIMISCVLIFSCKLCNKRNRNGKSIYDDVSSRPAKERLRKNWPEDKESIHEYDVPESGNMIGTTKDIIL